jgi:hypothetical protein
VICSFQVKLVICLQELCFVVCKVFVLGLFRDLFLEPSLRFLLFPYWQIAGRNCVSSAISFRELTIFVCFKA